MVISQLDPEADYESGETPGPRPHRAVPEGPPPPRRPPADKPLDASMAKSEIARALCLLYNLSHRLLKVNVRFKAADFGEEADGLYDLIQSHAPLRVLLRLASPLAAIGALWEKVELTLEKLKAKAEERKAALAAKAGQPVEPAKANGGSGTKAPFRP